MNAVRLQTEYLTDPIGIDIVKPRLFWNCEGGISQTAYQIIAVSDSGDMLWDSGITESASMHAKWGGASVPPRTKVLWRVQIRDENGTAGDWSASSFETGLPEEEAWQAQWITGNYRVDKNRRYPVDCFRKDFNVENAEKARLYITACGLYEARLNGKRIGNDILTPGITDYRKRVQYQTFDVTDLLKNGENHVTVQLADGWYRGSCGAWGLRNQYGTETKLLAQLEITATDGSVRKICTDPSWQWSNDGPIRFADNKDGEMVDSRRSPDYHGKAKPTSHNVVPSAADNVPVTENEKFPARLIITPSGKRVLDFGQNIAGYLSFRIMAKEGQRIRLRFGEILDEAGEFTQQNIQCRRRGFATPLQKVEYICREGFNEYKTTFAIFGFRYVLAESETEIREEDFTAIAVYSDMERTGHFQSSNPLLDRFVENTVWSAKGNSCDLPTDCPTRERHGWSGDAQIFCPTASYLFNYMPFARKYLRDLYDWQRKDGCLPQIAPDGGVDFYMKFLDGSVGWADAGVLIPYTLWKQYGDSSVLQANLAGMRRYARFMQKRCGKCSPLAKYTGLHGEERRYLCNDGQAYGEWAEPADVHAMAWKDCVVPHPETSTAYTAYVMTCMSEIETALGNTKEAKAYETFADGCRRSYQALMKTKNFSLDTDRQARLVRPLKFHLLDENQTKYAKGRLLRALEHYGWRLGTGFLSTPLILDVLSDIDIEAAYRLLENEEMPGWLFMPKMGATTIWESWEGNSTPVQGIASLNHYSKGAVCRWLFDSMCGIRVAEENRFIVRPQPGGHFQHASASYTSVYGQVESAWRRTEHGFEFTVVVPANCIADVILPDGTQRTQSAGREIYRTEELHAGS